jgi:hypothetical protein
MNTIINHILAAATKVAAVGVMTAGMLLGYTEAVDWACPILRNAVAHQEQTVSLYTTNFPGPRADAVRSEWEPKKADALQRIAALQATATSLRETAAGLTE